MSREAMNLALAFVKDIQRGKYKGDAEEVIAALQSALAEQPAPVQQEPTVPAAAYDRLFARNEANAARIIELEAAHPQQEPTKAMIDAAERIDWSDSDVRGNIVNMWQAMCAVAPPAQRKPLTDEQIDQMWSDAHNDTSALSLVKVFARAIEAAHGIKENT